MLPAEASQPRPLDRRRLQRWCVSLAAGLLLVLNAVLAAAWRRWAGRNRGQRAPTGGHPAAGRAGRLGAGTTLALLLGCAACAVDIVSAPVTVTVRPG